jgi:uncharacterized protein YjbI with pentapeptide repeats
LSPAAEAREIADEVHTGERLTGEDFDGASILDSRFDDCDLSAALFTDASVHRVVFARCRLSGANFAGARLRDVIFDDCKLDDTNFRMATGDGNRFDGSVLTAADFYSASLPNTVFAACDLSGAEFSKATFTGADLTGSRLEGISGAIDLRGVTIDGAQMIPLALSLFAALGIEVGAAPE